MEAVRPPEFGVRPYEDRQAVGFEPLGDRLYATRTRPRSPDFADRIASSDTGPAFPHTKGSATGR
jgi:hypothetical protein